MKILMVSDFYSPFIGGAEFQIQLLSRELVRRGHQVWVATTWHEGLSEWEDDVGVRVHRLRGLSTRVPWFSKNPDRRFHPPFPDPGIVVGLRRLITELRPDVVHAQGWSVYSSALVMVGTHIPLVVSARDYGYSCALRTLMNKGRICSGPAPLKCIDCARESYGMPKAVAAASGIFLCRVLLRSRVTAIHSVSKFVDSIVKRDLLARSARQTITKTIADIPLKPAQTSHPENTDYIIQFPVQPFILYVGALQANKGVGVLLDAYQRLKFPPPLVLIGTLWPDTPKTFPKGVTVLHNVPHPVVMAAWERALFGVAPSIWPDPLPGVIREAMTQGKAVIGTAVGGIPDMINNGENGLLVPPDDAVELAAAMQRLIENPDLAAQLGLAGRAAVQQFTANAIVPQFEALYQEAIARCKHV